MTENDRSLQAILSRLINTGQPMTLNALEGNRSAQFFYRCSHGTEIVSYLPMSEVPTENSDLAAAPSPVNLKTLCWLFFKLGVSAFGGPAAHIAMMEEEVVRRRGWLDRHYFLDLVGATNLIPGPNSTEMAIHVGYILKGWAGMLCSGASFILPAAVITAILAWVYSEFGSLPEVRPLFDLIAPVIIAIIAGAVFRLGKTALSHWILAAVTILAGAGTLLGLSELWIILLAAIMGLAGIAVRKRMLAGLAIPFWLFLLAATEQTSELSLTKLGFFFLKVGSVLFGSGYVLIAFIQGDLVEKYGWLTQKELVDAVAVGQFTPGPVLTTATFIGFFLLGWQGALVATLAVFLPSFVFVSILNPLMSGLRANPWLNGLLKTVNAAVVGLMAAVIFELLQGLPSGWHWLMALVAAILHLQFQVSGVLLVVATAVLGLIWLNL